MILYAKAEHSPIIILPDDSPYLRNRVSKNGSSDFFQIRPCLITIDTHDIKEPAKGRKQGHENGHETTSASRQRTQRQQCIILPHSQTNPSCRAEALAKGIRAAHSEVNRNSRFIIHNQCQSITFAPDCSILHHIAPYYPGGVSRPPTRNPKLKTRNFNGKSLKPCPMCRTLFPVRAHGMWTYEPRQGRKAATVVCSTSAVVTLAFFIYNGSADCRVGRIFLARA